MTESFDLINKWFNIFNNRPTINMKGNVELMKKWFDYIAQMTEYKTTLSRKHMTDSEALSEIKVLAKDACEYIEMLNKEIDKREHESIKPVKVSIDDVCDWIKKHHHEYSSWNITEYEIDFETDKLINDLKIYVSERL